MKSQMARMDPVVKLEDVGFFSPVVIYHGMHYFFENVVAGKKLIFVHQDDVGC